jgi:hypothetical protein
VAAALAATVPAGTPLSVMRYAVSGTAAEATPGLLTTSEGRLGVGIAPETGMQLQVQGELLLKAGTLRHRRDDGNNVVYEMHVYTNLTTRQPTIIGRHAGGTESLPTATPAGSPLLRLGGQIHDGSAFAAQFSAWLDFLAVNAGSPADRGSRITLNTTLAGTTSSASRLEIDGQGNLITWGGLCGLGTPLTATLGSGASYKPLNVKGAQLFVSQSSVQERPIALIDPSFTVSTDATRESRVTVSVYDATAAREVLRGETASNAPRIGFLGASAAARITLPSAATDATTTQALANALRTALITFGLGA